MPETSLPKLSVGIADACHMIGVGETLLREMLEDGRLHFSRIARKGKRGRILIRVADLDRLLDKMRVTS